MRDTSFNALGTDIQTAEIDDDAITAAKIADAAVSSAKCVQARTAGTAATDDSEVASYSTTSASYVTFRTYTVSSVNSTNGVVRIGFDCQNLADNSVWQVLKNDVEIGTGNQNGAWAAKTVDTTLADGDVIKFNMKCSPGGTAEMRNISFKHSYAFTVSNTPNNISGSFS